MLGVKTGLIKIAQKYFDLFSLPEILKISPKGYACNHKCLMCWRQALTPAIKKKFLESQKNELKINDYIKIIKHLPSSIKEIEIVGGWGAAFIF